MLITDHAEPVARAVAADLGIDQAFAVVRHEDKTGKVPDLLGEGLNDASAVVAPTDVGIAIDAGIHLAVASAGALVVSDDPRLVAFNVQPLRRVDLRRETLTALGSDRGPLARVDELSAGH